MYFAKGQKKENNETLSRLMCIGFILILGKRGENGNKYYISLILQGQMLGIGKKLYSSTMSNSKLHMCLFVQSCTCRYARNLNDWCWSTTSQVSH